mmetsp:Transcript_59857/g.177404  ORF Transcript_59857/g.177404 Transcript_59857/m.177404 type:complete len:86 (+) Transcript_59857:515-772(+)
MKSTSSNRRAMRGRLNTLPIPPFDLFLLLGTGIVNVSVSLSKGCTDYCHRRVFKANQNRRIRTSCHERKRKESLLSEVEHAKQTH